jgi:hypothetical protein
MIKLNELDLQYLINEKGEKTSVIIPIEQFEELLEDLEDLAIIADRSQEETISHDAVIAELKQDGIL